MGTVNFAATPGSWRRWAIAGVLLFAVEGIPCAVAQQPVRQSAENDIAIAQMQKLAGRLLAQRKNDQPAGELKLAAISSKR